MCYSIGVGSFVKLGKGHASFRVILYAGQFDLLYTLDNMADPPPGSSSGSMVLSNI